MRTPITVITVMAALLFQSSAAQIRATQLSVKDTSLNELALQLPNRIYITGLERGNAVFLGSAPPAQRTANIYTFRPQYIGADTLFIRRGRKTVYSKVYQMRRMPDPVLRLGNEEPANYRRNPPHYTTVKALAADPGLSIETGNFARWFVVLSFDLTIQAKGSTGVLIGPISQSGDHFSSLQLAAIKQLKPGDRIYIENIRAVGPDGAIRLLNSLILLIK